MRFSKIKETAYILLMGMAMYAFTAMPARSEEFKIGYVDSQKVLDNSLLGKRVRDELNEYVQSRQKIVDLEEADLRKLQEDLSRQGSVLSEEARQEKENLFQKKLMEYQKKVNELQKEIQQRRAEKIDEFNAQLSGVVKMIGEREGFSMILNNLDVNVVMYAKPALDLTSLVIEEMDKILQKGEGEKREKK